jgi:mono/diheme cytochrome c family protein
VRLLLWFGLGLALLAASAGQHRLTDLVTGRHPWPAASIARGAADFADGPCIACHAIDGISTANKGINLTHEGSRRDPEWLRHELINPTSPRPPIPAEQIDDLVAYLSSLR